MADCTPGRAGEAATAATRCAARPGIIALARHRGCTGGASRWSSADPSGPDIETPCNQHECDDARYHQPQKPSDNGYYGREQAVPKQVPKPVHRINREEASPVEQDYGEKYDDV